MASTGVLRILGILQHGLTTDLLGSFDGLHVGFRYKHVFFVQGDIRETTDNVLVVLRDLVFLGCDTGSLYLDGFGVRKAKPSRFFIQALEARSRERVHRNRNVEVLGETLEKGFKIHRIH